MGKSQPEWRRDPLRSSLPDQLFGIFSKDSCPLNYSWGKGEGVDTVKLLSLKLRSRQRGTYFTQTFVVRMGSRHILLSDTLFPPKSCPLTNNGKTQKRRKVSSKCRSFETLSWLLESCCDLDSMPPGGEGRREKGRRQNSSM